ncbi:branched-chain amino acid transport system ATP-binding protein [Rhodoligotrophos appendicifer]|uniref:ABC transporter ATP-binding protein n=1 Tax=Rhodoligotrophos appendicifer TaxID=987056 RepID=UPI00118679EC|nr:ABC transporter ATP-binding protein [Rhodoligotrophos appendicifer]
MLEVRDLHAGYGRVPVLHGINLSLKAGEIVLVLGANGAGKSTLLRTISGFIKPTSGSVLYEGVDITGRRPEESARAGLRLVLDGHRVFPNISVADNIRLGAVMHGGKHSFEDLAGPALEMFPILREKLHQPARELSGGQQQMVALAQAFAAKPKVLLCDEPSLGLAQALLPPILEFLSNWARSGTGIIIVEQQIGVALHVADRAIVIERGEVKLTGTADEIRNNPRVQDIYMGIQSDAR